MLKTILISIAIIIISISYYIIFIYPNSKQGNVFASDDKFYQYSEVVLKDIFHESKPIFETYLQSKSEFEKEYGEEEWSRDYWDKEIIDSIDDLLYSYAISKNKIAFFDNGEEVDNELKDFLYNQLNYYNIKTFDWDEYDTFVEYDFYDLLGEVAQMLEPLDLYFINYDNSSSDYAVFVINKSEYLKIRPINFLSAESKLINLLDWSEIQ